MKKISSVLCAAMIASLAFPPAVAEEGMSHYIPEQSETLVEALNNFNLYNQKVAEVLARSPLTEDDMEEIHEYTYTLEIALAKINETLGALPVTLEQLHLASETYNAAAVQGVAEVYLEGALPLAE